MLYSPTDYRRILKQAMRKGRVSVRIIKCVLIGAAGVGKTHLKYLLLGRKAPSIRISTPVAESPIRCVSGTRIQLFDGGWKEIREEDLEEILADYIPILCDSLPDEATPAELFDSLFHQQQPSDAAQKDKATPMSQERATPTSQDQNTPTSQDHTMPPSLDCTMPSSQDQTKPTSLEKTAVASELATTSLLDDLVKRMNQRESQRYKDDREREMQESYDEESDNEESDDEESDDEESRDLSGSNWIHLIDSGGQPEFHNLLPIFIHHTSSTILVQRLCDSLNDYPTVEYYNQEGKLTGMPYRSSLTNLEILKSSVRTMHSYPTEGMHNKIITVGTHRDMEDRCSETRAEKNEMLFNLLHTLFPDDLVLCGDAMEPIFPLNTKNPDEDDQKVALTVRQGIESSAPDPVDIPLWWYLLEIILQRLASQLGRTVLSRKECLHVAHELGFSDKEFDAALRYFCELNLCLHYPTVLPNVIFSGSQVPVDKLSELVQLNYELRQAKCGKSPGNPPEARDAKWLKFRDQGIVRLEFLSRFPKHFRDGLFTASDLLELLEHLLIVAPLSEGDYLMPSLLQMLPPKELDKHRTFSQTVPATLLIRFPQGWPRSGVFCCLVSFLMNHCQWKICRPSLVARNCIRFKMPGYPCSITLIDSFAYFEVHINAPTKICREVCPVVQQQIFDGIDAASQTLHYNNAHPEPAFFCSHPTDGGEPSLDMKPLSSSLHPATLSEDRQWLTCTEDENVFQEVNDSQTVWFGPATATSKSGVYT